MKKKIILFLNLIILLVVLNLFYLSIGSPITFLKMLVRATEEVKPKTINSLIWSKISDEEKALQILLEAFL
ncbi:MAG: hypothetical protein JL56_11530 [Desulfotomaculum sp. BICA1-6]|nr:MAG: hypothetical protein JL56_11530 [Desulfotomaculum sp. BICA1-6]